MKNPDLKLVYPQIQKRFLPLMLVAAGIANTACSHSQDHHAEASHSHHAHSSPADSKQAHFQLILNGEEKWLMDTHTRSVLATMQDKVLVTDDFTNKTEFELIELGKLLEQDLNNLIQGCTMQGGAHDALHSYLNELMPIVAELKANGSIQHAKRTKHLLSIYQDYFE